MATRKRIVIDQGKCIGCEKCVNACPGGALAMIDGTAQVVREDYCDGLGVCIGECPADAITFEDAPAEAPSPAAGCPGRSNKLMPDRKPRGTAPASQDSALGAWPIQLHLVQPTAPQFVEADILIAADCTAFACGAFHPELLEGRGLAIACPKLDDQRGYIDKLSAMFAEARPRSVTIARMVVPCCSALTRLVLEARERAGASVEVEEVILGTDGSVAQRVTHPASPSRTELHIL